MPSTSGAQHRLMEAAAHTAGGAGGVPQSVGKDFAEADKVKHFAGKKKKKSRAETLYDKKEK
jgi:hypothetical protein